MLRFCPGRSICWRPQQLQIVSDRSSMKRCRRKWVTCQAFFLPPFLRRKMQCRQTCVGLLFWFPESLSEFPQAFCWAILSFLLQRLLFSVLSFIQFLRYLCHNDILLHGSNGLVDFVKFRHQCVHVLLESFLFLLILIAVLLDPSSTASCTNPYFAVSLILELLILLSCHQHFLYFVPSQSLSCWQG